MDFWAPLETEDPEIATLVHSEEERTRSNLELIASESYPSLAVLQAVGSVLTAKYAEGYPGRRYYGGCEIVDQVEELARERAKALFGAEHVNVQPHAGAQANMAVYHALLERGDTVMGLALDQGGHLTHGSPVNFSGQYYNFVAYKVDPETHLIDMDQVRALAREHKPKLIVTGATAYPRLWDFAGFREIADEVGAILMTDMAHFAGLVAAGVHPSPIPHSQVVTTTTHKTLRGPRGGMILCVADLAKAIDKAVFPAIQGGPLEHVIAGKAVAFQQATSAEFKRDMAQTVTNAQALAARLAERDGVVITGGTDNHLMLVDVRPWGVNGKEADAALGEVNITVNKNTIPYDPNPPAVGSGIRLGTPAVTSRGMVEAEMRDIGDLIVDGIAARGDAAAQARVLERVATVADRFPVPGIPWTRERLGSSIVAAR
jgi:glycine hydroxymethyltransferase